MLKRITAVFLAAILLLFTLSGAGAATLGEYTKTIRYGSRGSAVTVLQEALSSLGYYQAEADGKAGDATVSAVRAFQADYGLKADGIAGPATWAKLAEKINTATDTSTNESTAEAETYTADPTPAVQGDTSSTAVPSAAEASADTAMEYAPLTVTVRYGMRGDSVRALQEALISLGYRPGSADGVCGKGTVSAIRAFQTDYKLTSDGVAGASTLAQINAAMQKGLAAPAASASPTPVPTDPAEVESEESDDSISIPASSLSRGDRGDDVYTLQRALALLGYYSLSLDGSYGQGTVAAVKAFQSDFGLTVDGQAGPKTLAAMDKALKKAQAAPGTREMLAWMDKLAQENGAVCGAAVITKDGENLLSWGWGGTDEDTCFRSASVTKWVTAIGLMTLYDQGLLDLDADISDYLPFPVRNPGYSDVKITARMLLNHTSSLRPDVTDYHPDWARIGVDGYDPVFMENLEPGTLYSYADFDGALFGSLIEAITGESVQTYMDRMVFTPLGLTAAYTPRLLPSGTSTADLLSTSGAVQISVQKDIEREFNLAADPAGNCGYTVGRLFINASSLSVLAQMMLEGGSFRGVKILEESTVCLMETDTTPAHSPYGLGQVRLDWFSGGTWYGHQGRYGGLTSNVYYQKESGITVSLILNGYDYRLENNVVVPAVSLLNNMDTLMNKAGVTVD